MNEIEEVMAERNRQDAKWGEQNHSPDHWLTILNEEIGEACAASLDGYVGPGTLERSDGYGRYRTEMIQVAAVALAAVESLDRGKWLSRLTAVEQRLKEAERLVVDGIAYVGMAQEHLHAVHGTSVSSIEYWLGRARAFLAAGREEKSG